MIGELKLTFNLELVLQGVDRAAASDEVWLAARLSSRGKGRESDARFRNLCRRLGFGMLGVLANGEVEVLVSPTAPTPRKNPRRRSRLVEEHRRRRGDPVEGGGSRTPIMTAYRQRALACAAELAEGPRRPRDLKASKSRTRPRSCTQCLWLVRRVERGVYSLTESGQAALMRWPQLPIAAVASGASCPPDGFGVHRNSQPPPRPEALLQSKSLEGRSRARELAPTGAPFEARCPGNGRLRMRAFGERANCREPQPCESYR